MSIITRVPWTRQPPLSIDIDPKWGGADAEALVPDGSTLLWRSKFGRTWTKNGAGQKSAVTAGGLSVLLSGTGESWNRALTMTGPFSALIVIVPTTVTGDAGLWSIGSSSADGSPQLLVQRNGTNIRAYNSTGYVCSHASAAAIGAVSSVVVSTDSLAGTGSTTRLAVNGKYLVDAGGIRNTGESTEFFAAGFPASGAGHFLLYWSDKRLLSQSEMVSLSNNPWQLFHPQERRIWVPTAGTGTHATTGALTADAPTIAGEAAHLTLHATTGALSAQAATIAGTAVHPHTTTGALSAEASSVSGAAAHEHATTGALSAAAASIAGDAEHTVSGAFASTGALVARAATVDGAAAHLTLHATTGALTAQVAAIDGTAAHLTLHEATGALVAGNASISGVAVGPVGADTGATGGYWPEVWTKPIRRKQEPEPEHVVAPSAEEMALVAQVAAGTAKRPRRITLADIRAKAGREAAAEIERVAKIRRKRLLEEDELLMMMD